MKYQSLRILIGLSFLISIALVTPAKSPQTKISVAEQLRDPARTSEVSGKPLLIIFYTNWSVTYKRMRSEVFSVAVIQELLSHFHTLYVNAEDVENGAWMRQKYQISLYPTILAYSPSQKLGSIQGLHPPHAFFTYLDFWYDKWREEAFEKTGVKLKNPLLKSYQGESRSRDELRRVRGFQLKTGRIIQGTPVSIEDGVLTLDDRGRRSEIPQYLLTPKARDALLPLAIRYMAETKSLVPGPFAPSFKPLKSLTEIKKKAKTGKDPVLVLVDPGQNYYRGLKAYLEGNRRTRNDLSYTHNFVVGGKVNPKTLNLIAKTYSVSYPALILLEKDKEPQGQSNLKDAHSFLSALANWKLGQLRKSN